MAKVWKISDAATIALHAITMLAAAENKMLTSREIASTLNVSEAHLSKVLQRLAKAELVKATRGPKGGFELTRPGQDIALLEVYEAIEGPLVSSTCLLGTQICAGDKCLLGDLMENINTQVKDYLSRTKLSGLVDIYTRMNLECLKDGQGK